MTRAEAAAVRDACADAVRVVADLTDVLIAIGAAVRLAADALQRIENDMIAISSVVDEEGQS